jgi:hypothetical protein
LNAATSRNTSVRVQRDLAVAATHDTGQCLGALAIGDHAHVLGQQAFHTVERDELLAFSCASNDHGRRAKTLRVEGMHWLTEAQQHEVRDVDDAVDGANTRAFQASGEPIRARADADTSDNDAEVARATVDVLRS